MLVFRCCTCTLSGNSARRSCQTDLNSGQSSILPENVGGSSRFMKGLYVLSGPDTAVVRDGVVAVLSCVPSAELGVADDLARLMSLSKVLVRSRKFLELSTIA